MSTSNYKLLGDVTVKIPRGHRATAGHLSHKCGIYFCVNI